MNGVRQEVKSLAEEWRENGEWVLENKNATRSKQFPHYCWRVPMTYFPICEDLPNVRSLDIGTFINPALTDQSNQWFPEFCFQCRCQKSGAANVPNETSEFCARDNCICHIAAYVR